MSLSRGTVAGLLWVLLGAQAGCIPSYDDFTGVAGDGRYEESSETISATPETLSETPGELPAAPSRVIATIEEEEVVAGSVVAVLCTVEDAFGNVLEVETAVDPQSGYDIDGTNVTPTVAGEYDITCSAVGMDGLDKVSDHLLVTAGPVAAVVLYAKPEKQAYSVGDKVDVTGTAVDEHDNPVPGAEVVIAAPDGLEVLSGGKFKFLDEGAFTFKGTMQAPSEDVSGERTLFCDESGPVIVISEPARASTLDGNAAVGVKGTVLDALCPTVELEVNGNPASVDVEGDFAFAVMASHGLNSLDIGACDGFGNCSKVVQSFLYSSGFVDYATEQIEEVMLEQSALVFLGQKFLDDGEHDKQEIDDVATLVEMLLDSFELGLVGGDWPVVDTAFPNIVNLGLNVSGIDFTLTGDLELVVHVLDVSFAEPAASFGARDGGVDMAISFLGPPEDPGILVQLNVEIGFKLWVESTLGGDKLFSAAIEPAVEVLTSIGIETLLVEVLLDIGKNPDEELTVKMADLNVAPAGIHVEPLQDLKLDPGEVSFDGQQVYDLPVVYLGQLVGGIDDILSSHIIDPVLNFVIPGLLDLLEPIIEQQVTTLLQNLLGQFELEVPLPIPQLPGSDKAVAATFKTRLSSVKFTAAGGELGLAAGFMAPKGTDKEVLGSILRSGCLSDDYGALEFDVMKEMEFAAHLDMLNEFFFVLWWTGCFQLELEEVDLAEVDLSSIGITDLAVATDFWLPPILDDCSATGSIEVQVGDLLVTMSFELMGAPITVTAFVTAKLDAVLAGKGSQLGLQILAATDIGTQVMDVDGDIGFLGSVLQFEDLVEGILVPTIIESVSNEALASFPLPEVDLSALVPGIPLGSTRSLDNLGVDVTNGYALCDGELK